MARPFFPSDGGGGVSDHGALTGLGDDDHTQYTKASGARAFTGVVAGVAAVGGDDLTTLDQVTDDIAAALATAIAADITDHGDLDGLADDDHPQYAAVDGRAGGQALVGGTESGNGLDLDATSHATKGIVGLQTGGGHVQVGGGAVASELRLKEPSGGGGSYAGFVCPSLAGNRLWTLPSADGAADEFMKTNGAFVLSFGAVPSAARSMGDFVGLTPQWISGTTIRVTAGTCRNKADSANLTLAADVVLDITASGDLGLDVKALTGTGTTVGTTALVGTGTAFRSEFGVRTITTGTFAAATLAVTGVGTRWLTGTKAERLCPGDLVGNDLLFSRVLTVPTDTTATVSITLGTIGAGTTIRVIEGATVSCAADKRIVDAITTDTALVVTAAFGTNTAQALACGVEVPTYPFHIWTDGSLSRLSTQYTVPYAGPTAGRRIGAVMNNASGDLKESWWARTGQALRCRWIISGGAEDRIVSAGLATVFTAATLRGVVPQTACAAKLSHEYITGTASDTSRIRPQGAAGGSGAGLSLTYSRGANTNPSVIQPDEFTPLRGSAIEYANSTGGANGSYISVLGWEELSE